MRKGFTLVELSIVLVIIGLLIGGILVAQSMISTAKINKLLRQIQQYDAAVSNFQTKYNGLPGDSSAIGCVPAYPSGTTNTCNNGIIEDQSGINGFWLVRYFDTEEANFWPNLQSSGFIIPGINLTSTVSGSISTKGPNANIPSVELGINSGVAPLWASSLGLDASANYYGIADWTYSSGGQMFSPKPFVSIPVMDALAIDTKIDDGIPTTGNVIGMGDGGGGWPFQGGSCSYNFPVVYNTPNPSDKCVLAIKMLVQTGQ